MKKTLITLGLLCLLAACKKSSNNNPQNSINGKWTHTKIVLSDDKGNILETTNLSDTKDYVQFNDNGTGISSDDQSGTQVNTNFTYGISDKILTIVSNGENDIYTIQVLTSNTLVLHYVDNYEVSGASQTQLIDDYFNK
jgi:hypothetical protein